MSATDYFDGKLFGEVFVTLTVIMNPLGTPLLAGPGAIVATIVVVRGAHGVGGCWRSSPRCWPCTSCCTRRL